MPSWLPRSRSVSPNSDNWFATSRKEHSKNSRPSEARLKLDSPKVSPRGHSFRPSSPISPRSAPSSTRRTICPICNRNWILAWELRSYSSRVMLGRRDSGPLLIKWTLMGRSTSPLRTPSGFRSTAPRGRSLQVTSRRKGSFGSASEPNRYTTRSYNPYRHRR